MCRSAGASPGRRRATRLTASLGFPHGKRYSSSFLQGHPPSLRFGHPDVTTDDTAFPRWGTMRVRPRFPGSRSRPRCRSVPVHLPKATSGYPLGCSPQRSKERERSAREGGFPCRSVGRCAPAASLGRGRGTRTSIDPPQTPLQTTTPKPQISTGIPGAHPLTTRPGFPYTGNRVYQRTGFCTRFMGITFRKNELYLPYTR